VRAARAFVARAAWFCPVQRHPGVEVNGFLRRRAESATLGRGGWIVARGGASETAWRRGSWRRRLAWIACGAVLLFVGLGAVGCSILGSGFQPSIATPAMAASGLESRWVDSPEGRIHYVVAGDVAAPPVLFVHGSPGTWEAWRGYLNDASLRGKAWLVAADRVGFGGSERGQAEPSLERQGEALARVLEAEGGRPAVVVGHSLGGPVAARLAVDRPDLVASLLLVAPSIDPEFEKHRWFNVAGSLLPVQWFLPVDWITSNREIWPLRRELEAMAPRLAEIRAPTVVIQGDRDDLVAPANADFVATAFRGADVSLVRIPDVGHFVVWERPAVLREAIETLLQRAPDGPPSPMPSQ